MLERTLKRPTILGKSVSRLLKLVRTPDDVDWYLKSYIPILEELAAQCCASRKSLDKALLAYGG